MAHRPQTPQEKKRLDYERQQRGGYRNSVRGMRKGVPKKKRHQARRERQAVSNVLSPAGTPEAVVAQLEAADAQLSGPRSTGRLKSPGITLREWVDGSLERRAEHELRAIRPRPSPYSPNGGPNVSYRMIPCGQGMLVFRVAVVKPPKR